VAKPDILNPWDHSQESEDENPTPYTGPKIKQAVRETGYDTSRHSGDDVSQAAVRAKNWWSKHPVRRKRHDTITKVKGLAAKNATQSSFL
jgi:hypothetical protein